MPSIHSPEIRLCGATGGVWYTRHEASGAKYAMCTSWYIKHGMFEGRTCEKAVAYALP